MGTKYSSQSASGYNSSPPADDGSTTEANKTKWATVKTKLGDPVKNLADAMNTALVTALDKSCRSVSASDTAVASDHERTIQVTTAGVSITLSDAATMGAGYIVTVANQSGGSITVGLATSTNTIDTVTNTTNSISTMGVRSYVVNASTNGYVTVNERVSGADVFLGVQGRLTLTSATAITTSDVTGATTVYFTPYHGNKVEIYDGSAWQLYDFTELSQATTDATKSPAAVTTNSNYDVFVWNDSGTLRATRGPAWSTGTARGAGIGTTELELFEGRYVNKIAITNGPAARRGTYVGTIRSDASSQINDSLAKRHVWNNYNRVPRPMRVLEATNSWTYTTLTWRQANNSSSNQLDFVIGLSEDAVDARVDVLMISDTTGISTFVGIGLDVTNARTTGGINVQHYTAAASRGGLVSAMWTGFPGIGNHYLAWVEMSAAGGTTTWYGDNNAPNNEQSGISGSLMA